MTHGLLIDNFAGGGGASVGIEAAMGRPVDVAINHDPDAIAMHTANHPHTLHLTEDVFDVSPLEVCKGRPVDVAWFSPDCTHFSKAKGGSLERDEKIRGLAWIAADWAEQVAPRLICLENVEEFITWGPLDDDKRPIPERAGETFWEFVNALQGYGYAVEWKLLSACDYGAPTSRRRFFMIARNDGEPIVWPEATHGHSPRSMGGTKGGFLPYRTAAECIDWSIPTVSIFATKEEVKRLGLNCIRPLAENTLRRIARGVWKFIIDSDNPYILDDEQTASFMGLHYTGKIGYGMERPLATITQRDHHTLVAAMLTRFNNCGLGQELDRPTQTILSKEKFGLVSASLITIDHKGNSGGGSHAVSHPLRTTTVKNRHALVASYLTKMKGTNTGSGMDAPVQTITAGGLHHAQVTAFLLKYYGQGIGGNLTDPMHTVTSKDRFGLVTVRGETYRIEDIGLRMLQPHELAAAQGFPADYILTGNKTSQVARIGNSVPPPVVTAILRANATWNEAAEAEAA